MYTKFIIKIVCKVQDQHERTFTHTNYDRQHVSSMQGKQDSPLGKWAHDLRMVDNKCWTNALLFQELAYQLHQQHTTFHIVTYKAVMQCCQAHTELYENFKNFNRLIEIVLSLFHQLIWLNLKHKYHQHHYLTSLAKLSNRYSTADETEYKSLS